jgi:hypothetical protein
MVSLSCRSLQKKHSPESTNVMVDNAIENIDSVESILNNCNVDKNSIEYKSAKKDLDQVKDTLVALKSDNADLQKSLSECNANYIKEVQFATVGKVSLGLAILALVYGIYKIIKKFVPGL